MKQVLHLASSRGAVDMGWLKTFHSFSFSSYYNPEKMHFGVLRVLNDDDIAGGAGFGMHPHDNMEIITIPLEGALAHKDSMGNSSIIRAGDVQVMSAGTGIYHSEYNAHESESVKLFQIWVFPDRPNVTPRYQQISLQKEERIGKLQQILSPDQEDEGVWIYQKAWFHLGQFEAGTETEYRWKRGGNGLYMMVVEGSLEINGTLLNRRDAIGISEADHITWKNLSSGTEVLLMELPMIF